MCYDAFTKSEFQLHAHIIILISFHYLLHVAESIEDFGPCRGYWQFPMERMCGMLIPLVKSQIHPYANLWNNLILNE